MKPCSGPAFHLHIPAVSSAAVGKKEVKMESGTWVFSSLEEKKEQKNDAYFESAVSCFSRHFGTNFGL